MKLFNASLEELKPGADGDQDGDASRARIDALKQDLQGLKHMAEAAAAARETQLESIEDDKLRNSVAAYLAS